MNSKQLVDSFIKKGQLKREQIGLDQIRALIKSSEKNISAARKIISIDEEASFTMAYNSMLKLARAVLFANNFRPDDGQQHKTTIEVAGIILGLEFCNLVDIFDKMRKKRNQFTYDPMTPVSKIEAKNALKTSEEFFKKVRKNLQRNDPQKRLF